MKYQTSTRAPPILGAKLFVTFQCPKEIFIMVDITYPKLLFQGCITVFRIPARTQDLGPTRTVCVNPSVLLDCLACMHNETEPREFVPRFIKAGFLERYWPTNTKPNDWTLRSAIDDIVSKGLIREAVIPLCFQVS